jgi:hypothetical protein
MWAWLWALQVGLHKALEVEGDRECWTLLC